MLKRICIDPGHPSYFKGTKKINWGCSFKQIKEVEVNLQLAKLLEKFLNQKGFKTKLTRKDNTTIVSNKKRAEIARDFKANLFFRIHIDWERHNDSSIKGIKTIYPPPSAKNIHKISRKIALIIHEEVISIPELVDRGVCDERVCFYKNELGMLEATFWANKFNIPTVLLEAGYLSNPEDRKWITKKSNQEKLMRKVAKGIEKAGKFLRDSL